MILYAIRHKRTGELMPLRKSGKGYSYWNPDKPENDIKNWLKVPRFFDNRKNAECAITMWNAMPNSSYHEGMTYSGTEEYGIKIKPDGRLKSDLEVIKVSLRMKE